VQTTKKEKESAVIHTCVGSTHPSDVSPNPWSNKTVAECCDSSFGDMMTVPSLVLDTACKDLDNWPRTTPRLLLRVVVVKDRERDVAKKSDGLILVLGVGGTKAANTSDCGFRHKHGHQQPPNTKSLPSYYYHFPAITNHQPRFEIPMIAQKPVWSLKLLHDPRAPTQPAM